MANSFRFRLFCFVVLGFGAAGVAEATPLSDQAIYHSRANFGAPGMYMPDGPDAVVSARLTCPDAHLPTLAIVLPAGASEARYVIPQSTGPFYQPIAESLTQDYAHAPNRILFRLHYGPIAVDGYLHFDGWHTARFHGPDCAHDWRLAVRAVRLSDTYKAGSLPTYGASLTPFPDEPQSGTGF